MLKHILYILLALTLAFSASGQAALVQAKEVRALEKLTVVGTTVTSITSTLSGATNLQLPTALAAKAYADALDAADGDKSATNEIELPTQTGNSGKFLKTDGTATSWGSALTAEVDASVTNEIELPTQTGNSGKFLSTDGSNPSWVPPPGGQTMTEYSAGTNNGSTLWVRASAAGITMTRSSGTVTVSIPAAVKLFSFRLLNTTNPGTSLAIVFNYASNSTTNQDIITANAPQIMGIKLGGDGAAPGAAPWQYIAAGNTGVGTTISTQVTAVSGGNITITITNYNGTSTFGSTGQGLVVGSFAL